jgi:hypothetical protein
MKSPFALAKKYLEEYDEELPAHFSSNDTQPDITEGHIIAVKICSHVLDACIWLALDDDFKPDDDERLAVFYASEIPLLRDKSEDTLRKIHETRLVFKGGRVIDPDEVQ